MALTIEMKRNSRRRGWRRSTGCDVRIFYDTNVILDVIANRPDFFAASARAVSVGAGTIVGFTPAANGVLHLTNPTAKQYAEGKVLKSRIILPLTLTNPGAMDNLASWKVFVDGKLATSSTVVYKDGNLVVRTPRGLYVIFR